MSAVQRRAEHTSSEMRASASCSSPPEGDNGVEVQWSSGLGFALPHLWGDWIKVSFNQFPTALRPSLLKSASSWKSWWIMGVLESVNVMCVWLPLFFIIHYYPASSSVYFHNSRKCFYSKFTKHAWKLHSDRLLDLLSLHHPAICTLKAVTSQVPRLKPKSSGIQDEDDRCDICGWWVLTRAWHRSYCFIEHCYNHV